MELEWIVLLRKIIKIKYVIINFKIVNKIRYGSGYGGYGGYGSSMYGGGGYGSGMYGGGMYGGGMYGGGMYGMYKFIFILI